MNTSPSTVIAQYRTVGGATVEAYGAELAAVGNHVEVFDGAEWSATKVSATAVCSGCSTKQVVQDTLHPLAGVEASVMDWAEANAKRWAQAHAETCRALPRAAN